MTDVLNHRLIAERYFFPRRAALPAHIEVQVQVPGATLGCMHRPAPDGAPTLVHFHGNGEVVADYLGEWLDAVSSLGIGVFLAEYRGYGTSSGEPRLGVLLEDVEAILDAAGPGPLVVYGRSVGSIFAVRAAAIRPIAGLVLESGIADVAQRLLMRIDPGEMGATERGLRAAVSERANQRAGIAAYNGPLLVMHARDDQLVGFYHAEANFAASKSAEKRLVGFHQGGHNAILYTNWPQWLDEVRRFVARC